MKKVFIILTMVCIGLRGFCQQDSTQKKEGHRHKWEEMEKWHEMDSSDCHGKYPHCPMSPHQWNNRVKPSNISTNWLILDLGFANYNDKTNYGGATAQAFAPGSKEYWFSLKNSKSVDVNIWLFMQ